MRVSVCMPTYRRPAQLAGALAAVTSLDAPDGGYEVVVVDDGSPAEDGIADVVGRAAAASPVPVRTSSLPANRGPAAARNAAWRTAGGEWIAFTDDDCRPARDWLVRLIDAAEAAGADVVQGRTEPDPDRAHLLAKPFARSMRVESFNDYYQTCNLALRRNLMEKLDGFDEGFRLIGDDTDLGWRAVAAGAPVTFADDAIVYHDVVVRDWKADVRSRRRWADTVRVVRKHPGTRRLAWKPLVFRREHVSVLAFSASLPLLASRRGRRVWAAGVLGLVASDVIKAGSPERAAAALQTRVGDAYEVVGLARASVRERTLLL